MPCKHGVALKVKVVHHIAIRINVMLAAPATPSCYIMAKNMNNDGPLTASIVVSTTLVAAFTLTGWMFVLRSLGYI